MTSEVATALAERLDEDTRFTAAFEDDPLTTLRDGGFAELAEAVEQDRDRIGKLINRIYRDEEFRASVEEDPMAELIGWGVPEAAVGPLLLVAGAPDEVLDRSTGDVEAHVFARQPATVATIAAVIGTFAFAQQASAASNPATSTAQTTAQLAQVAPQFTAQVRPATWHGIQPHRAKALGSLSGFLSINRGL